MNVSVEYFIIYLTTFQVFLLYPPVPLHLGSFSFSSVFSKSLKSIIRKVFNDKLTSSDGQDYVVLNLSVETGSLRHIKALCKKLFLGGFLSLQQF